MEVFIRALLSTPVSLRTHRGTELSDCATPYGALTEEEFRRDKTNRGTITAPGAFVCDYEDYSRIT